MSALLEHVNSVTPDQFGDLRVDSSGGFIADRAMTPILATPAVLFVVVVTLLTQCASDTPIND